TITGGFWTDQTSTKADTLTGKSARDLIAQLTVHAVHVADFPTANANITSRNVKIRADMAPEFCHESLAEAHDLIVALALRVEVRTTFTTAQWQCGQCILEHLLKSQELENAQVHGWVKTKPALVGADGAVHLYPIATIDLHLATVINP